MNTNHYHVSPEREQEELEQIRLAVKNPEAFAPLYDRYFEAIFRFVYQRCDSKDQAFDITQQAFVKALQHLARYEHKGVPFVSWLYRIARNEFLIAVKKQQTQRTLNVYSEQFTSIMEESGIDNELNERRQKGLVKCLAQLNEPELQLVEMRYFEQIPYKQVADVLEIKEGTAKVRMLRVLDKLKKCITNR
ncbi:MAG: sigma-70 family RNA polymerase sigma factor [Cytophagaceae bacterium]